jgi:hypothetical protein
MRIPRFRGDLPQRRHERPSGLAPGRAKRRWPARGSFFRECQRCEIMAAAPTRVGLGLGRNEPRPLPVVSSASRRLEVGKRWRWARLGAMPIDVQSRMRVRANLPPCSSVAPTSGGKPERSRPDLRFVGGPGALRWVVARQKFCVGPVARVPRDDFPQTGDHLPPLQAHLSDP